MGVPADTPVVVQFDRPVVPQSLAGRVSVAPAIPGCDLSHALSAPLTTACRVVWTGGNTAFVIQHPKAIFAPLTRYRFTVLGGFTAPDGAVNSVDHGWDLTTGSAPEVRGIAPSDGTEAVPVDSVVTVNFSGGMATAATAAAIQLDPPVPGSRVERNSLDASRFVLFPGHLLDPNTRYRVVVSRAATDQHHQPLLSAAQVSFTTGLLSASGHAVVLAKRIGELPTRVLIAALAPAEAGVPVADAVALEAPRCHQASGCGDAPDGQPLYSFASAVLSPGGRWLAAVERDATAPGNPHTLVVLDAARVTAVRAIPGGDMPAWSPDGATLAYASGKNVALYEPADDRIRTLPPGDPLVAPAVWGPQGELLALEVGPSASQPRVELADAKVAARYALPGVDGLTSDAAISPDGSQLALLRRGPSATGTWIASIGGATSAPRPLDAHLTPIGYAAGGTLLAVTQGPDGASSLVRVNVDSDDHLSLAHPPQAAALATVVLSSSLLRFAFVAADAQGVDEAYVENADGTATFAITSFGQSGLYAAGVTLSG